MDRGLALEQSDGLVSIDRFEDNETAISKRIRDHQAYKHLVLNHQNFARLRLRGRKRGPRRLRLDLRHMGTPGTTCCG
jgi:hypothetical protein